MCRRLIFLTSFVLVLALAGTNVAFGQVVWEGRIEDTMDAVEQSASGGGVNFSSSDLEFMDDGGIQTIGLRFVDVYVPPGATITNAYVEFTRDSSDPPTPVNIIIQGELTPNASAFTSTLFDVSNRPKTTAVAKWSPEPWPVGGQQHQTSDISVVIEEIVNQPGWASGNALVLIFDQDPDIPSQSVRTADTGGMATAPLLHIEYMLGNASRPSPADGAIDVPRDVVLSWKPGKYAATINGHNLYFSDNFDDVSNGIGVITQSDSSYTPPQRLDFGTTYYWRVDEVNNVNPGSPWIGSVWSFTTELLAYPIENVTATASSQAPDRGVENVVNGSGLDEGGLLHGKEGDDTMWLSGLAGSQPTWIEFEFDQPYKLHELFVWNSNDSLEPVLGFGFKDVTIEYSTNGTDYTTLGSTHEFARATGMPDYAHNTTIDMEGVPAMYVKLTANSNWGGILPQFGLSEVRFLYIPVNARKPDPESGATGVPQDVVLGWVAGREAVTHDVYLSTDEQAVIDGTAPVATVAEASYGPLALDLGVTHYWKVNEVNEAETITTWESAIWSFTTSDHIIVDDFESYNDLETGEPGSKRIFNVWIDGYGVATNGSVVGYENAPFCEQDIVHGGKQSMPFFYTNTGGAAYSEAELTLTPAQDWTVSGVVTLAVHFHGTAGNTGQLYVKVNGSKVTYDGEASNLARATWQAWNIDLASLGVNLQSITKLAVGIDGNGAAGKLYFDDIRLYPYGRQLITPVHPDPAGLVAHYEFEGNTNDSAGANHGTPSGGPTYAAGKIGQAINLDGTDDYVSAGAVGISGADPRTIAGWAKATNLTFPEWVDVFGFTGPSGDNGHFDIELVGDTGSTTHGYYGIHVYGWEQDILPVDLEWHHLAASYDGTTIKWYGDGLLIGSGDRNLNTPDNVHIGKRQDNNNYFPGLVDDVYIYNRVLTDAEVAGLAGITLPFDKPF